MDHAAIQRDSGTAYAEWSLRDGVTGTNCGSRQNFPRGVYVGNPGGTDATEEAAFEAQYNAFVANMGGSHPLYMDTFTDYFQDLSNWTSNAAYSAYTWTLTGNSIVGPGSGVTPVVGVPLASNAGGWANVDTFYKGIIAGQYDTSYTGMVDAWAKAGCATVQFRLGYEFNDSYEPWSPCNDSSPTANADFVSAFQHVATLIHSEASAKGITGQVDWNTSDINNNGVDPTKLYPGDSYVDIVSTDTYSPSTPTTTRTGRPAVRTRSAPPPGAPTRSTARTSGNTPTARNTPRRPASE